jgi:hypothetical protein
MMTDDGPACTAVIDTHGLHELALSSSNLKPILLDQLKNGVIAIPTCAWQEFEALYEDEAAEIAPYATNRIIMKKAIYVGAARIADKLNSGFSRGAYDNHTELYTASIASNSGLRVLTASAQVKEYNGMDCEVSDLITWIEQQLGDGE